MAAVTHSTQVLAAQIKVENNLETHITIEEKISRVFKGVKVYSVSSKFDTKKTVLERGISHGLAAAILHAYNEHQHLRLTPDDVWLTIAQGVSRHINYNAEKFRSKFVEHEGKKEISVFARLADGKLSSDWSETVNQLVIEADKNIVERNLKSLLECDFSTTTEVSRTASRIVLLDAVKAYFSYKVCLMCGIPKITLEGTLDDWIKIQKKTKDLRKLSLEMDFWLDRLDPVVENLVATYKGEIDQDYWSKVSSRQRFGSGPRSISGWMLGFFPYDRTGERITNNTLEPSDIPDGRVEVPFKTDTNLKLKFVAGFMGANQEVLEGSNGEVVVSPVIGTTSK
ncbi:9297_t:CDS:2 [Acaulospora colombiana]|uniref:9297_t:CDS:1 n=1 Tax=Acaulospora colombiana TaxID=27376 RepID=A0ACA9JWB5_9GLOM|nr:9297_t:CDS:2 [Acaulospora colombiana]